LQLIANQPNTQELYYPFPQLSANDTLTAGLLSTQDQVRYEHNPLINNSAVVIDEPINYFVPAQNDRIKLEAIAGKIERNNVLPDLCYEGESNSCTAIIEDVITNSSKITKTNVCETASTMDDSKNVNLPTTKGNGDNLNMHELLNEQLFDEVKWQLQPIPLTGEDCEVSERVAAEPDGFQELEAHSVKTLEDMVGQTGNRTEITGGYCSNMLNLTIIRINKN